MEHSAGAPQKPNAEQDGGKDGGESAAVVAETEPKGDTAHQLIQLADAEWLVEEGKKCSYWTDVTVSTVDGLILITKELQRIDAPDQRWQCATSSEHPTRYATVDMDLDPPLTVAKVGTFRVLFFVLIRLPTRGARSEMVSLFGNAGAVALKQQMWWVVLMHPNYGQALVPISKCQKSELKCAVSAGTKIDGNSAVALFQAFTKGQAAGTLADLKRRHKLLSFEELKNAVEAAAASASGGTLPLLEVDVGDASSKAPASDGAGANTLAMEAAASAAEGGAGGACGDLGGGASTLLEGDTSSKAPASDGAGAAAPAVEGGAGGASGNGASGVGGASGNRASGGAGGAASKRTKIKHDVAAGTAGSTTNGRNLRQRRSATPPKPSHGTLLMPSTGPAHKPKGKRQRDAVTKASETAAKKEKVRGGRNAWTNYVTANFAAKKAHMITKGHANPLNKDVQAELLADYKQIQGQMKNAAKAVANNVLNHDGGGSGGKSGGSSGCSGSGGGGGSSGGGSGGASGLADARGEEGRKEKKKSLKRQLREAQERAQSFAVIAAQLNATVSAGASAAQTVDTQARAGAQHSAQRADHVSDIPGSSTVLSPSPPDSVKKLKRSIAGLNRVADYHKDAATLQRLGELEYELDDRKRKKQKTGTW